MREEVICEHVAPAPGKGNSSAKDGSAKRFPFHPYPSVPTTGETTAPSGIAAEGEEVGRNGNQISAISRSTVARPRLSTPATLGATFAAELPVVERSPMGPNSGVASVLIDGPLIHLSFSEQFSSTWWPLLLPLARIRLLVGSQAPRAMIWVGGDTHTTRHQRRPRACRPRGAEPYADSASGWPSSVHHVSIQYAMIDLSCPFLSSHRSAGRRKQARPARRNRTPE